jgi:hypothetical protein
MKVVASVTRHFRTKRIHAQPKRMKQNLSDRWVHLINYCWLRLRVFLKYYCLTVECWEIESIFFKGLKRNTMGRCGEINLAQHRNQWRALVHSATINEPRVIQNSRNFLASSATTSFWRETIFQRISYWRIFLQF